MNKVVLAVIPLAGARVRWHNGAESDHKTGIGTMSGYDSDAWPHGLRELLSHV